MVHHVREWRNTSWMYLHVRKMVWTREGWPVVSPQRYAGEQEQEISEQILGGEWEFVVLDPSDNLPIPSKTVQVNSQKFRKVGENDFVLNYNGEEYEGKVLPAWDWERWRPNLVFTGISKKGIALWGKRVEPIRPSE